MKAGLTDFQKGYCQKIMNKLKKKPTTEPFWKAPSKDDDRLMTLFDVKTEMYLDKVQEKLDEGKYKDYIEWGSDIRKVWANAMQIYGSNDLKNTIASELSDWFENIFSKFPRVPEELWVQKLKKLHSSIKRLNKHSPIIKELLPSSSKSSNPEKASTSNS